MDQDARRHIYKYFPSEDRFVRVLLSTPRERGNAREIQLTRGASMDAEGYRQAVVSRYVEFEEPGLRAPLQGLDELFGLVLDVNPHLALGVVRLAEGSTESDLLASVTRQKAERASARASAKRLCRLAQDAPARLGQHVFGQPEALEAMSSALGRAALGFRERGPLASVLMVGPTGVGKTEMARALARELGAGNDLVRIDCSEYAEGHEYAKLLGAPPGYVGHQEGGQLAHAWRDGPPAVVLFDEIEKAHSQLHNLLLQILDEGVLSTACGRKLTFGRSFLLMTSNAGTQELEAASASLGFDREPLGQRARQELLRAALARSFRPELLARIDETLLFNSLGPPEARRIAQAQLARLAARVRQNGMRVRFSSAVARWVAQRGLDSGEGARGVLHTIGRHVEGPLAREILGGQRGGWVSVTVKRARLNFRRD